MNKKTVTFIKDYSIILVGTLIAAIAIYFFMLPDNLAVGSVSGLVLVLSNVLPFKISTMTMVLNVLLLIVGFLTIGKEFGIKTVVTSILLPIYLRVFEKFCPNPGSFTGDAFLNLIGYVFLVSIGMTMLFWVNASSGGLDIVAKIMNKYLHVELGSAVAMAGILVALTSVFVYDKKTVLLSVLGTYLTGIVVDHFILGFHIRKRVCILTEKKEEVLHLLMDTLHCGATLYEAIGGYDNQKKDEIITIVNRSEYSKIMNRLYAIDPNAFVTVYTVNEVIKKQGI